MKTLQAKYGKTCAVLLGDVLHITVFDLLSRLSNRSALGMMTRTIKDMCYGQLLDVRRKERTAGEYEKIIRYKTGALMATACAGGVAMSGAAVPEQSVRAAGRFGLRAGMLYQMADDYRDGDAGLPLTPGMIVRAARRSRICLRTFGDSRYRQGLHAFVDYVASMARQ
jgi:heptaprenyl diphosphate synthase